MDFLAFLVPKLWPKYCKLIRGIPANPLGDPRNIWHYFGLRNIRKLIKGSKDSLYPRIQ